MSGTTKPKEERELDEIIDKTRYDWHCLKTHLERKGEGVSG
jgi:hypothetical protein